MVRISKSRLVCRIITAKTQNGIERDDVESQSINDLCAITILRIYFNLIQFYVKLSIFDMLVEFAEAVFTKTLRPAD
jgi:hypothetical protein